MNKRKILQISETSAWAIRSIVDGRDRFFITDIEWVASPNLATIFRTEEAAAQMIALHLKDYHRLHGEIIEPVPLCGALESHGKVINIKPNKGKDDA